MAKKDDFKLTENQVKKLCDDYKNKKYNIKELATIYDLTDKSILNYLHRNNVYVNKGALPYFLYEKIKDLYINQDKDIVTISKIYSVNPGSIHRFLKRYRIEIKDSSKSRQRYSINQDYFNIIDTELKAYFLGFLYADGCLTTGKYQVTISLQEQDKYILELFMGELNYNGPLRFIDRYKKIKESYSNQYALVISNKKIYNDLLNLNLTSKKSLTLTFPNKKQISNKLVRHFIRGYFDGDGCVSKIPSGQKYISMLGTKEFLTEVQNIFIKNKLLKNKNKLCKSQSISNTYQFKIGGNRQLKPIIEFLYKNATGFLTRKKEKLYNYELSNN